MGRAMVISSVLLAPWGLWGLSRSDFRWKPALAIVLLGVFGIEIVGTVLILCGATLISRGSR